MSDDGVVVLSEQVFSVTHVQLCVQIAPATTDRDIIRDYTDGRMLICSDTAELPDQAWETGG